VRTLLSENFTEKCLVQPEWVIQP